MFEICITVKSTPEIALFKDFQEYGSFIDRDKYETGISCDDVANLVEDKKQETINYANKYLEVQRETKLRGDYKEFLELVIIFHGVVPERGVRFMSPGVMHIPVGYPK